ncbi:MAG: lipopolysaccharide biosynthesis protein [Candidatus Gastranaerophilales bacterium]|nr:lipopolysaccharide biosynthesis protein [Candidatus Gastranaerophilales bacterium]
MNIPQVNQVGDKARQSIKWSFGLQIIQKSFLFISSIIIARILTPDDFGLATMAITFDTIMWLMLSLGVNSAFVHFQDKLEERLQAGFWLFIFSSAFFALVQILLAPTIAGFYKAPLLKEIIQVSAIALFISSFGAMHKTVLIKSLEFKKISILEASLSILKSCLYVIFALLGFGVWSFIYPKIIHSVVNVVSLWKITNWRPKLQLKFEYWAQMLSYGKNVLFSNVIDYVINNSSYIIVGILIGSTSLGFFTFAYEKSMMIVNNITLPLAMIFFPTYSRLQNHPDKLKNVAFKTIKMIALFAVPYGIFQIIMGKEFITFVYGQKWLSSVFLFQILVLFSSFRAIMQCCNPILQAIGRPDVVLRWNMIYAPLYIGFIFLGYKLSNILGIAIAVAFIGILGTIIYMTIITKIMKWSMLEVLNTVKPAFICAILSGIILYYLKTSTDLAKLSDAYKMLWLYSLGGLIYFAFIKLFFSNTFDFIIENASKFLNKKEPQNAEI